MLESSRQTAAGNEEAAGVHELQKTTIKTFAPVPQALHEVHTSSTPLIMCFTANEYCCAALALSPSMSIKVCLASLTSPPSTYLQRKSATCMAECYNADLESHILWSGMLTGLCIALLAECTSTMSHQVTEFIHLLPC